MAEPTNWVQYNSDNIWGNQTQTFSSGADIMFDPISTLGIDISKLDTAPGGFIAIDEFDYFTSLQVNSLFDQGPRGDSSYNYSIISGILPGLGHLFSNAAGDTYYGKTYKVTSPQTPVNYAKVVIALVIIIVTVLILWWYLKK